MKLVANFALLQLILVLFTDGIDIRSPYNQYLPDCTKGYNLIRKKTEVQGIVCPMVKDEIGFMSEWVAFYEVHGFNHIMFFDNNSTLPMDELKPWIDSNFVSISNDWWTGQHTMTTKANKYYDIMKIKMMAEVACKKKAIEMGYEIFVSLDLDEYLMPRNTANTVMDELVEWFNSTTRGVMVLPKFQFPPTPHILEPINLLTIEAYQTRMKDEGRMNYYTSVSPKIALRMLNGLEYTNATLEFLTYCCDFHGCGNYKFHRACHDLFKAGEKWKIEGKHKKWKEGLRIHHYARSFEKYMMKQATWETSGGHGTKGYDMYNFLDRQLGHEFDNSAVVFGCQVRDVLRNRTGIADYVRPGDMWYRNPEFGKTVSDPGKRGRHGAAFGKQVSASDMNPYPEGATYQNAHKVYKPPAPATDTP